MKRLLFCVLIICFQQSAFSQKEWSNWYYDGKYLLTFKNGYPENVTNFITNPPPVPPYNNMFHFSYWGKQGISYSNPVSGDMKFIISNRVGYGYDFNSFPNDTFILSCPPAQQSYHIIPFNNNPNKFYVVQFQSAVADLTAREMGLQVRCPNAVGLAYSIVDLSLNGGVGDFTSVNNVITRSLTEQIATIKHANGRDVWIVVHPYNSAEYRAYLVSSLGIQPSVTSTIGAMINTGSQSASGMLSASHDGKLLAGYRSISYNPVTESDIELFDFDNATGVLSNYRTMPSEGHINKLCFSPDNTKLYAAGFDDNYRSTIIYQWDFNISNVSASRTTIANIQSTYIRDMQLAPDGKIYLNNYRDYDANGITYTYLSSIQCPNLPQYASNFKLKAFQLLYGAAFPFLINDFLNEAPVVPTPSFSIGNDTIVCFGTLTISAPLGWESYQWNTGETTRNITVTKAGTYYVLTGNTGFSCPEGYGYINVADAAIKLNLGKDTLLCRGTPYSLHIPNQYTNIIWENGSNTRDSLIYNSSTNIISAIDENGCYTSDTLVVSYKQYPKARFGADTTLCGNETLLLKMEPPRSSFFNAVYLWQNNSPLDTFRVKQPGTYWGTVTYQGCTMSDTINVQYISGENFTLGNDTTLCEGDSLLIKAPLDNAIYLWNTGATSQSIKVFNSGKYHVRVTNGLCTTSDTIKVTFNHRPVLSLGIDTALCEGNTLVLNSGLSGGDFLWQNGSTQPTFTVNSEGLYWLKYILNGCEVSDTIKVEYKNSPPVNLDNDTSFCLGGQIVFEVRNPAIQHYLWQDQSTQSEFVVTSGGTYFVTVTGYNGCKNSDTVNIQTITPPVINLGGDTSICADKVIMLSVTLNNLSFLWNTGNSSNSIIVDQPGLYWLRVTRQGCSSTDSIVVNFNPIPVLNLGVDSTLCERASIILNAENENATYVWQDGSTGNYYNVIRPGLYHVTVKNANGCTNSDSINVKYLLLPIVTLGNDTLLCPGQTISLTPNVNTNVQYSWQNGSNLPSINVSDTGTFTINVENFCGTARSSIIVRKGICQLYIPNSFTPNGDNLNDIFRIKYPFSVKQFQMSVYNRYGQIVFTTEDMAKGWDGNFKGVQQPRGTFVWIISFTDIDGRSKVLQGTVLLLR